MGTLNVMAGTGAVSSNPRFDILINSESLVSLLSTIVSVDKKYCTKNSLAIVPPELVALDFRSIDSPGSK